MLTNTSSDGPVLALEPSMYRDKKALRAEARRLRDFFIEEALRAGSTKPITKLTTLTFDEKGLSAMASLLHQFSILGEEPSAKD